MTISLLLAAGALLVALALRPWRMLANPALISPWLATLVILPWLWALPRLQAMPLQLPWSGACLAVLMLGWPLAVPTLCLAAALSALIAATDTAGLLQMAAWLGVVPATLASALGAALRRWVHRDPFVYILGRAFLGTAACVFAAGALAQWSGHELAHVDRALSLVARALMAAGEAFVTGMLAAVLVAFRPEWLATWSDRLYLKP